MKVRKAVAAGVTSLGLVVGLSGLAGATSGTIGNTGPLSNNQISATELLTALFTNNNNVGVNNANAQGASTGSANVSFNTTGGSAVTGNASNSNNTSTSVNVHN